MLSLFVAKTPVEVCVVRDSYLEEWISAGWIKPLDDIASKSEIDDYKKILSRISRERAFYKGQFWGSSILYRNLCSVRQQKTDN